MPVDASARQPRAVVLRVVVLDLLLRLAHLLLDLAAPALHLTRLEEHPGAEHEEEQGRRRLRPTSRYQRREEVAHGCGEDGHDDERAERAGEDEHPRVPHREDGGDEECLVPNFGDDDHGERLHQRLDAAFRLIVGRARHS